MIYKDRLSMFDKPTFEIFNKKNKKQKNRTSHNNFYLSQMTLLLINLY